MCHFVEDGAELAVCEVLVFHVRGGWPVLQKGVSAFHSVIEGDLEGSVNGFLGRRSMSVVRGINVIQSPVRFIPNEARWSETVVLTKNGCDGVDQFLFLFRFKSKVDKRSHGFLWAALSCLEALLCDGL